MIVWPGKTVRKKPRTLGTKISSNTVSWVRLIVPVLKLNVEWVGEFMRASTNDMPATLSAPPLRLSVPWAPMAMKPVAFTVPRGRW